MFEALLGVSLFSQLYYSNQKTLVTTTKIEEPESKVSLYREETKQYNIIKYTDAPNFWLKLGAFGLLSLSLTSKEPSPGAIIMLNTAQVLIDLTYKSFNAEDNFIGYEINGDTVVEYS